MSGIQPRSGGEPFLRLRDNPLLIAMSRRRLRRKEAGPTLLIAAIVGLCGMLFVVSSGKVDGWRALSYFFLVIISFALYLRGTTNVAGLIVEERQSGILDFHRASPTSPMTNAVGYLLGGAAREYAASGVLLVFLLLAAIPAELGLLRMVVTVAAMVLSAWLYHAFSMMLALSFGNRRGVAGFTLVGIFILLTSAGGLMKSGVVLPAFLTPLPAGYSMLSADPTIRALAQDVSFFGITLHPLLFTLLVQGSMLSFLMVSNARKLERETSPSFSRRGAFAFFSVVILLLMGGSWERLASPPSGTTATDELNTLHLFVSFYLMGAVTFASVLLYSLVPNYLEVVRGLRRARRRGRTAVDWLEDAGSALPLVPAYVGLITVGFGLVMLGARDTMARADFGVVGLFTALAGVSAFLAFVAGAIEYVHLYMRRSWRGSALFIAFAAFVLPFMLTGIVAQFSEGAAQLLAALSPLYGLAGSVIGLGAEWGKEVSKDFPSGNLTAFSIGATSVAAAWFFYQSAALRSRLSRDIPLGEGGESDPKVRAASAVS